MDKKYHIALPPLCQACVKFRVKVGKGAMYRHSSTLSNKKEKGRKMDSRRWLDTTGTQSKVYMYPSNEYITANSS